MMKNHLLLLLLCLPVLLGLCACSDPLAADYADLQGRMGAVTPENYEEIGALLSSFPEEYGEIAEIRTQYDLLVRCAETLTSDLSQEDHEALRSAWEPLDRMDRASELWDLTAFRAYIESEHLRVLIYGRNWTEEALSHNFYWGPLYDGEVYVNTSLPRDADEDKLFRFFTEKNGEGKLEFYIQASYKENGTYYSKRVLSYTISPPVFENGGWVMAVYCHLDRQTYLLRTPSAQESF